MHSDDPSVLFISTHQFPYYPGTGAVNEVGLNAGEGYTINIPLPAGCGDAEGGMDDDQSVQGPEGPAGGGASGVAGLPDDGSAGGADGGADRGADGGARRSAATPCAGARTSTPAGSPLRSGAGWRR